VPDDKTAALSQVTTTGSTHSTQQRRPAAQSSDVVIVTGAAANQKGTPEGYRLRGHNWPERWILDGQDQSRAPELFIAGELLSAGAGRCWR
jgi:hypothetical protein